MCRPVLLAAAFALTLSGVVRAADADDPTKLTVDLAGSIDDEKLAKELPAGGVVVSQKGWEKLAAAWGLKDPPKVDFTKELLAVATTRGSVLKLNAKVDDKGDLKVLAIATRDLRPGFRYAIKSVRRAGVKTVNGQPLPTE